MMPPVSFPVRPGPGPATPAKAANEVEASATASIQRMERVPAKCIWSRHRLPPPRRWPGKAFRHCDANFKRRGRPVQRFERTVVFASYRLDFVQVPKLRARDLTPVRHGSVGGQSEACPDRKSTRLNSSHVEISYAVF